MSVMGIIKKIFFWEIIKGLALTFKNLLAPAVTRQYPEEKVQPVPGARALHALTRDEKTGEAKCVGCGLCAAICPSNCIHIYTSEDDEHRKVVDRYEIDTLRCMFCAFCVEACPYGAVVLTPHFEYAGYSRSEFYYTKEKLLDNWDKYMSGARGKEYFLEFWGPKSSDFVRTEEDSGETGAMT